MEYSCRLSMMFAARIPESMKHPAVYVNSDRSNDEFMTPSVLPYTVSKRFSGKLNPARFRCATAFRIGLYSNTIHPEAKSALTALPRCALAPLRTLTREFVLQERLRGLLDLTLTRKQVEFGGLRAGKQTMRTARKHLRPPFHPGLG